MVNVTVLNKKDVLKYGIKIITICAFIISIFNILKSNKNKRETILPAIINEDILIKFIQTNIPIMEEINISNKEKNKEENINPLKYIIETQIGSVNFLKEKTSINEKENIDNEKNNIEHAQIGLETKVIENNVPTRFTNSYGSVQVRNESQYELTQEMLIPNVDINKKNILIFHTHTCESYTSSPNYEYEPTGTYRTTDYNYNVVRVGLELKNQLESYGYNVIQDNTYHDYPAYNGSYDRSLTTIENLLNEIENTDVVIDIHRDAIGDYSYSPSVQIGDEIAAQLMFVIGTDGGGLEHPNWNENLKFAIKIQEKANELYPGLFKPIILRNSRYNQHLAKGACIIEVGATGNTMDQCLTSMKYLAKVMSEVME